MWRSVDGVMWALQQRGSELDQQLIHLVTKHHHRWLSFYDKYATLSIKKYDNGKFSLRPISHVLYPIQGTVHLPQTNNVTEIHRVPSTIRSNFRSMFGDDNRTSKGTIGTRSRFYAKPSRFEKQETFHIEVVTFKTALICFQCFPPCCFENVISMSFFCFVRRTWAMFLMMMSYL